MATKTKSKTVNLSLSDEDRERLERFASEADLKPEELATKLVHYGLEERPVRRHALVYS